MTKVAIVGANSFIGQNFIRYSINKDVKEIDVLNTPPGNIDFKNIDVVIHLAAIVHRSEKISADEYFKINRDLAVDVAKHSKNNGVKHFIFLSSSSVYGNPKISSVYKEDSICYPDDFYGKSKYEAEILLKDLGSDDFIVTIIRTPIVFGEGVKANMLNLIKLVDSFPVLPFKGVDNKRSITYVENLVSMLDKIIKSRSSGTYIITDDKPLSTTELVQYISANLEKKVFLFKFPSFIIRALTYTFPRKMNSLFRSSILDNTFSKKVLNFTPPVSSEEGIKKMVLHYKTLKRAGK